MNYKAYMKMIRRSIDRINANSMMYTERGRIAFVNIGLDLRQIECIIDEAYNLGYITYNMYRLLRRWYRKYYDNVIHNIIWL